MRQCVGQCRDEVPPTKQGPLFAPNPGYPVPTTLAQDTHDDPKVEVARVPGHEERSLFGIGGQVVFDFGREEGALKR